TRVSDWFDGIYLSHDASLDVRDHPLPDGTGTQSLFARMAKVHPISLREDGLPAYLKPGESYTATATFRLPESIGGDYHLIVYADTAFLADGRTPSDIRDGLVGVQLDR
ncbi:MAG TPA: hypothetical protein DCR14_07455, partial [Acidimicrobiaceae bacterium]|nr:hypothetical protein [Acidimicrobiaceae bacterium]